MHMANLGAALKRWPPGIAGQIKLVFVTTDPTQDTRMELRRWLDNFDKRFVGLTGNPAALDAAQKAAGVPLAQKMDPGTAAIHFLCMPTLLYRTPKTTWATSSTQVGLVKTTGFMTCPSW
jgi:cytochrome oxidase Cu insertion factor (SCO1/SenC/PrrC family)